MPSRSTQTDDPVENATGSRFFDKLPRELRNEIYRLAYATDRDGVIKLGTKRDMIQAEWRNRDPSFKRMRMGQVNVNGPFKSSDQFTGPVMHQFLVNKQYYEEAVEEYFREFALDQSYLAFPVEKSTAVRQNLRFLDIKWSDSHFSRGSREYFTPFYELSEFVSLRKLQIEVSDTIFRIFKDRIPCLHTYSDADFARLRDIDVLLKIPALETVRLLPAASNLPKDQQEQDILAANFDALQKYIDQRLEKVKKTGIKKAKKARAKEDTAAALDEDDVGSINHAADLFGVFDTFENRDFPPKSPSLPPSERDWQSTDPPGLEIQDIFEGSWMSAFAKKYGAFLDVVAIMGIVLLLLCMLAITVLLASLVVKRAV